MQETTPAVLQQSLTQLYCNITTAMILQYMPEKYIYTLHSMSLCFDFLEDVFKTLETPTFSS